MFGFLRAPLKPSLKSSPKPSAAGRAKAAPKPIALTLPDGESVVIQLRKRAGMKRLVLRKAARDDGFILSMPPHVTIIAARAFCQSHLSWLSGQLAKKQDEQTQPEIGDIIALYGQDCLLVQAAKRAPAHYVPAENGQMAQLHVYATKDRWAGALKRALTQLAYNAADAHLARFEAQSGLKASRLAIRDTKSRWGSCNHKKQINLSWRLIMAPPETFAAVAAHELAHTVEMNHSAAFWAIVQRLMPDYQRHRDWLKAHGGRLMAVVLG